jgi:radical SAM protein with 4Fe4S-binding SPASM domain
VKLVTSRGLAEGLSSSRAPAPTSLVGIARAFAAPREFEPTTTALELDIPEARAQIVRLIVEGRLIAIPSSANPDAELADFLGSLPVDLVEPPRPVLLQIELTNQCPYECVGCPRQFMTRPVGFMPFTRLRDVIDQRHDCVVPPILYLHQFGESILHPEIGRIIRYVADAGLAPVVGCRPTSLTPQRAAALFENGLAELHITVNGLDDDVLRRLDGPHADATRSLENIKTALALRRSLRARCRVVVQMLRCHANRRQWSSFVTAVRALDDDVIVTLKPFDFFTRPELARHAADRTYDYRCLEAFTSVCVLWNGDLVPCSHDHDGALRFGHVDEGIAAAWRKAATREFRDAFCRRRLPADHVCRGCCWWPTRVEGHELEQRGLLPLRSRPEAGETAPAGPAATARRRRAPRRRST